MIANGRFGPIEYGPTLQNLGEFVVMDKARHDVLALVVENSILSIQWISREIRAKWQKMPEFRGGLKYPM